MTINEPNKCSLALVSGASGFIGRNLCAQLQQQGIRVRALLRKECEGPWDEIVDKRVYGLAGHMARLAAKEPDRVSVWVLEYGNCKWIVNQADAKGNQ